jgi:tocopherol cyclase
MRATMFAAYRTTGADPPFGDPRGYHGVGMEGYFWRITQPARGTVVVVLLAVNRDAAGGTWGMLALATHPGGFVRAATVQRAAADPHALRVRAGDPGAPVLEADDASLRVDLGPDARVDVAFADRVPTAPGLRTRRRRAGRSAASGPPRRSPASASTGTRTCSARA